MTAAVIHDQIEAVAAAVANLVTSLDAGELGALSNDDLVEVIRDVEALRRSLTVVDYPLVRELEVRDLADVRLTRDVAGCLQELWRISRQEARRRVEEAAELGTRVALTGAPLEPRRPVLARARALGVLSDQQVGIVLETLDRLPADLPMHDVENAERILVQAAHALAPKDLRGVAQQLLDTIDPDGHLPSDDEQQRRRDAWLQIQRDGMVRLGAVLDPVTGAKAVAYINARSAPRPDDATGRDDRTAGQRRHDALADLFDLGLRTSDHPTTDIGCDGDTAGPGRHTAGPCAAAGVGGGAVTAHVFINAEDLARKSGRALTSFGQRLSLAQAFELADEATIAWLVRNSTGGILNYGRKRRLASKAQAEALIARDRGCCFPGCAIPAEWCERHHIKAWIDGGETDLANLVLLCKYHHRRMLRQGWEIRVRDLAPEFIPPAHIDPGRTPLRNLR